MTWHPVCSCPLVWGWCWATNQLWSLHRFRRVSANKAVFQGLNSVWNIGIAKTDWEWDVLWFLLLPGLAIVPVITNILYANRVRAVWRSMEKFITNFSLSFGPVPSTKRQWDYFTVFWIIITKTNTLFSKITSLNNATFKMFKVETQLK